MNEQKKKQLLRIAKVVDQGSIAIVEYIQELEDKIDNELGTIKADVAKPKLPPELIAKIKQLKGDTGENGKDGVSPKVDYGYIIREVISQIPIPQDGKDAVVDYPTIINKVLKQIKVPEVDYSRITEDVLALIRLPDLIKGDKGEDGSPDTGEEIITKINYAEGQIDASRIKNLPTTKKIIERVPVGSGSSQVYHDTTLTGNGTQASPLKVIGGGSNVWGSITGTLSSQTDLQTVLNTKLSSVSLTNTYVGFGSGGVLSGSSSFTWDGTNLTVDGGGQFNLGSSGYLKLLSTGGYNPGFIQSTYGNFLFSNNLYFNGTDWKYNSNGYGVVVQTDGTAGNFNTYTSVSGTAGNTATLLSRFSILNNGDIGIGVASPDSKLEISYNGSNNILKVLNNTDVSPATNFIVNRYGQVGIFPNENTSYPSTITANIGLEVRTANTINWSRKQLFFGQGSAGGEGYSFGRDYVDGILYFAGSQVNYTGYDFLSGSSTVGLGTSRFKIDTELNNSNVGINTSSPSAKLHVIDVAEQLRLGYDTSNYFKAVVGSTGSTTFSLTGTTPTFTFSQKVINSAPQNLKNYTVGTLPTGVRGDIAYVTDALSPTFGTTVVAGGSVVIPVFYNGSNWVSF